MVCVAGCEPGSAEGLALVDDADALAIDEDFDVVHVGIEDEVP